MPAHLLQIFDDHGSGAATARNALSLGASALRDASGLVVALRRVVRASLANAGSQIAPLGGYARDGVDDAPQGDLERLRSGFDRRWRENAPTIDARDQPRIHVDLTDVLSHAIWHDTCAGIPRVQLEVATRLFRSNLLVGVFGFHQKKWCDLGSLIKAADGDVDRTFALLRETFSQFRLDFKSIKTFINKRRRGLRVPRRGKMPDIRAQDCLYIGGAFWINSAVVDLCQQAAANNANLVVLLHDLIPLSLPAFTGHDFAQEYRRALRLPAHFVVTSELNRSELKQQRRRIDEQGGRTCSSVIPLADEFPGSKRNERAGSPSARLETLAGADFALCVGTIEIRKNHHALLGVWRELAAERGGAAPKLVIAGRRGWKAYATLKELDALSPDGHIVFVDAPSDNELRWLYASCLFTVFPSFFEGWGLPVGESFWFGKPCAASNAPSIAPVARDLCAFFSPYHEEDMKGAIGRLLNASIRESFQRRIESAPLRKWSDVAGDIETLIAQRRPLSDPLPQNAGAGQDSAAPLEQQMRLSAHMS